ncbi:23S rRNA (uracil(1939)-C(5))-methyltransferase RlmD [Ligilactobacillus apodemi]|uniref:tRNA (Uracil-5-)-methyltransferase n=1 Tax=Ligilactobacillus apodemi DSM 16634 = JCM 16172 TaxID=1423724 RepID=A0A0R1TWJ6_9LACO|nr:23S rRNA (uracil(1939)-C(5))-methyltransferase RlmD [Ligilactobacillus apodemi]KRL83402.1 tRNA (Uracil-5-) -methyltransferase [Ligilactobacillus apodemi DSM 16634 = JCM 16172]
MKRNLPVTKNQKLTATIMDLTYQGMGVAKVDGYSLFCDDALPGEEVVLHVLKTGKNFGYAKVVERLTTSPERVTGKGKAYSQTGIAPLQHLAYPAQLKFKQKLVSDLLQKAHLDALDVAPTLGMQVPYAYRNKAQVPVREINGELKAGFFKRGSHNFLPLDDFLIQDKRIDEVIQAVLQILQKYHITAYDEATHSGTLRHIMVRRGHYSNEVMVVLVTRTKKLPHKDEIVAEIIAKCPDVVSLQQNINSKQTNVILGDETHVLAGKEYITDQLNGLKFEISAKSFYQVNPTQTEKLYQEAIKRAGLTGKETVIDAYCGIGTISLSMAKHAKKVYGVEIVEAAIADAKKNAALNNLDNLEFEVGNAEEWMATWQEQGIKPDVIMVDPPRKGLTQSLIESATKMQPTKIVYVSCNPATLVRDLQSFMDLGYKVTQPILPVDQFPQTAHVETVTVLERSEK